MSLILPSLDPIKICGFCFKPTLNLWCLGLFNFGTVLLPVSKNDLLLGSKASCLSNQFLESKLSLSE